MCSHSANIQFIAEAWFVLFGGYKLDARCITTDNYVHKSACMRETEPESDRERERA